LQRLHKFKSRGEASKESAGNRATKKGHRPTKRSTFRSKAPPKFRNPDNPSEVWSGRGLQPRWLRAALGPGKSIDDFRIGNS
jgi:DNA-binding protein H-NS